MRTRSTPNKSLAFKTIHYLNSDDDDDDGKENEENIALITRKF
jgi:hypothetical protein